MKLGFTLRAVLAGLVALALVGCDSSGEAPPPAVAADAGDTAALEAAIEERQALFEAVGDAFKVIRGELEGDAPSVAVIGEQAAVINERAQAISGLWPEGSSVDSGLETEALPSIWEQPDEFAAATEKLVSASASMVAIAASGELGEVAGAVRPLGMACKGCHDNFRLDTD